MSAREVVPQNARWNRFMAAPVPWLLAAATVVAAASVIQLAGPAAAGATQSSRSPDYFTIPVSYHRLSNGLRVVVSPDTSAPIVAVAVYYGVGFRTEPRGRTGFAHLFEHMMFQGSRSLPKGAFDRLIEGQGGAFNGSTNFDFTNYFQVVPAHILEQVLWAEADRMAGLVVDEQRLRNQQDVVKNEVLVNVVNQPYGGFPWLDVPQHAFENWQNAHNFYGDFADLEAATLEDVRQFFRTYYAPNNAVLVISGHVDPEAALGMVERHFGGIPRSAPARPVDVSEPRQEAERRASRGDSLATRPALAAAYRVPERGTPEHFAMGLLDQILLQGDDARLHQVLVREKGYTGSVDGGINLLGNMFNYDGPMLWTVSLLHDPERDPAEIVAAMEQVLAEVRERPVDEATLERARVKMRSTFYGWLDELFGFGRADLLASFALFDDDPGRINQVLPGFAAVTPELLQRTAREYLRPTGRTVLTIEPAPRAGQAARTSQPSRAGSAQEGDGR